MPLLCLSGSGNVAEIEMEQAAAPTGPVPDLCVQLYLFSTVFKARVSEIGSRLGVMIRVQESTWIVYFRYWLEGML